jgi:uncharacterized RDD family membrane protein YckC
MSNEPPPPPGQPPEDDPFSKRPNTPPPPSGGSPYDSGPPPPPHDQGPYGGGPYGGSDPLAGMPPLAEPGKRILARLIDFLIISVPLYLISLPFGGAVDVSSDGAGDDDFADAIGNSYSGHQMLWSLIGLVVYVAYDTYLTHKDGRTLGKRLLKMRVAMLNDGSVPDTGSALMRAVVLWLPALLCCPCLWWLINIVMMFTDKPYRQGLQDKAARTVVVSVPER